VKNKPSTSRPRRDLRQIRLSPTERATLAVDRGTWNRAGEKALARGTTRNAVLVHVVALLAAGDPRWPLRVVIPAAAHKPKPDKGAAAAPSGATAAPSA
jgi:hypothetical protein